MAVLFESSGGSLTLGGTSADPFPRYSISREDVITGGGEFLHTKYNITVSGTRTSSADITTPGARQAALIALGEAIIRVGEGEGKLTISPYGGGTPSYFLNTRLVSSELPEQSDESAGVQFIEYSLAFESFDPGPTYLLNSAEESWEVTMNEGPISFVSSDPASVPKRTFSMTHTVSATGHRRVIDTGTLDADGEAWRQASLWVKGRLVADPLSATRAALMGGSDSGLQPRFMDKSVGLGLDLDPAQLNVYNHLRTYSTDHGGGSCSVTESWTIAHETTLCTHDIDISINIDPEAEANTVTVTGTIQGINTTAVDSLDEDKYANAVASLAAFKLNSVPLAQSIYAGSSAGGVLRAAPISDSEGHNRATGTVTFTLSYDDKEIDTPGAVDEDLTVTYDNVDHGNEIVAIIGVIDNAGGPVIQDMNTTNEAKVSVSVDITMDENNRGSRPLAAAEAKALPYRPASGYRQTLSETWNPETGVYNYSISWVYTS